MYVLWSALSGYLASVTFKPGGTLRNYVSDPEDALIFEYKSSCYSMLLAMEAVGIEILRFEIHQLI